MMTTLKAEQYAKQAQKVLAMSSEEYRPAEQANAVAVAQVWATLSQAEHLAAICAVLDRKRLKKARKKRAARTRERRQDDIDNEFRHDHNS